MLQVEHRLVEEERPASDHRVTVCFGPGASDAQLLTDAVTIKKCDLRKGCSEVSVGRYRIRQ